MLSVGFPKDLPSNAPLSTMTRLNLHEPTTSMVSVSLYARPNTHISYTHFLCYYPRSCNTYPKKVCQTNMISWFVFTVMILNLCAFLLSWQQQQQRERELRKQQEREQRRRYEEMEQLRREEERRHAEREQVHTCTAKHVFVVRKCNATDMWTTMLGVSLEFLKLITHWYNTVT